MEEIDEKTRVMEERQKMLEIKEKDPLLKAGEGAQKTIKMLIAEERKVVTD